ncbi:MULTISPECIES: beta-L-arabinofuranosidase domain-containing protein [unclassified Paraflavitalea]|uniref:glycoside hydrolase family 127 protein n=1 Tax=unclassified Paraflavitalea TaxID=2798305 RepID=UPI003D32D548
MNKLHAFVLGAVILGTCLNASNGFSQSFLSQKENSLVKVKDKVPLKSYSFPLQDVKITRSPFTNAMQKDSAYLMLLNPDRLLYRFNKNAGLPPKDSIYGGWESDGLSGHTLGHYLSALSMMYVSTGQVEFKNRINYIVSELERCQKARGTGYVGAIPKEDSIFAQVARGQIKSSGFDLNGGWSPWYTVHKVMAGLCDAYLYADNKKALDVVVKMADWTYNTVNHLSDSIRLKMLNCEYGGMNDVLANIYSFTGNKKYLDLSYKFYDEFVMGKLAKKIDPLPGKHSNTNVPKAIGSARQFELTGNESDKTIASFFWSTMVNHHSYVIGGNSNYEYCGQADSLSDRLSDNTCETCNTYNMLKLTRHLFGWQPDSKLMDYYERALYNHILASQNPETGMMCYFVPLRMGTQKQFSDSFNTFTCCVGSGIENHSKYGESIYGDGNDGSLFINLFIPSVLNWKAKQAKVQLATTFPNSESMLITITQLKPKRLQIRIRKPFWLKGDAVITINQKPVKAIVDEFGYWLIDRTFGSNDRIQVTTPMGVYTEAMPDNPNRVAFKYGPIVLAGVLGKEQPDPVYGIPVLLTNNRNAAEWLTSDSKNLVFQMKGVGQPKDVTLIPFYKTYDQYYSVYWDFFTKDAWTQLQATYEAEKKRQAHVESITIDNFRIGEMQPERDHQLKASERSYVDAALGRTGREARAQNYFEFVMKVNPGEKNSLLCTYIGDDKDRNFDIKVNGKLLTTVNWKGGQTGKFYDFVYPIPSDVLGTGTTITVRVEANYGKTAGRIFGVRTIKE